MSAILRHSTPLKYKDPGCPTISCVIGNHRIEQALLDLGANVSLPLYSLYKQLGLGELKPNRVTLQLANRSMKIPRGNVEDVLLQINKFYFPIDYSILDTQPVSNLSTQIPIILGHPFFAASNALINSRNGVMNIYFGNIMIELNVINICQQLWDSDDELHEADLIETIVEDVFHESSSIDLSET